MRITSFPTSKPTYSCPQPSFLQSDYRDSASSLPRLYTSVSTPELLMMVTLSSSSFFPIILPLYIELLIIFSVLEVLSVSTYLSSFLLMREKKPRWLNKEGVQFGAGLHSLRVSTWPSWWGAWEEAGRHGNGAVAQSLHLNYRRRDGRLSLV